MFHDLVAIYDIYRHTWNRHGCSIGDNKFKIRRPITVLGDYVGNLQSIDALCGVSYDSGKRTITGPNLHVNRIRVD
jgi:hypothetical protein